MEGGHHDDALFALSSPRVHDLDESFQSAPPDDADAPSSAGPGSKWQWAVDRIEDMARDMDIQVKVPAPFARWEALTQALEEAPKEVVRHEVATWLKTHGKKPPPPEMTKKEKKMLMDCFLLMDSGGAGADGTLDAKEVYDALCMMGYDVKIQTIQEAMDDVDRDGDGNMDFNEFIAVMKHSLAANVEIQDKVHKLKRDKMQRGGSMQIGGSMQGRPAATSKRVPKVGRDAALEDMGLPALKSTSSRGRLSSGGVRIARESTASNAISELFDTSVTSRSTEAALPFDLVATAFRRKKLLEAVMDEDMRHGRKGSRVIVNYMLHGADGGWDPGSDGAGSEGEGESFEREMEEQAKRVVSEYNRRQGERVRATAALRSSPSEQARARYGRMKEFGAGLSAPRDPLLETVAVPPTRAYSFASSGPPGKMEHAKYRRAISHRAAAMLKDYGSPGRGVREVARRSPSPVRGEAGAGGRRSRTRSPI